jgi:hypothetical protein
MYESSTRKKTSISLSYKDTTGYFGIYFNKPSWWVMRHLTEGRTNWIGFNIEEEIGMRLIPEGMARLAPSPYAKFRIQISSPEDAKKLDRLILASFERTIHEHVPSNE